MNLLKCSMYRQGKITLRKAAEIMGVSLQEMIDILEAKTWKYLRVE